MEKITELAIAKKLFGGGIGKREGTAIPAGEVVERIYFNTELPVEEMLAYLSQLTYVQTPLLEYPLCAIYANTTDGQTGIFIVASKLSDTNYVINLVTNVTEKDFVLLYGTPFVDSGDMGYYNGWHKARDFKHNSADFDLVVDSLGVYGASIADFNGIPVGAENEKIKNVLSITPF